MKYKTKINLFFILINAVYILQAIGGGREFPFVYYFGFSAVAILLYIIKNKYISVIVGLVSLLAMEFYNTDYKQLTVIAFLLMCAHKDLVSDMSDNKNRKKATNAFSFYCVQLSLFATVALFIYDFVIKPESLATSFSSLKNSLLIFFWLITLFIFSTYKSKKRKDKTNKQLSGKLRFMYLVSILALCATALFLLFRYSNMQMTYYAVFYPWFVYIVSMVYNGDPYITSLCESIENKLNKISLKVKVKE